MSSKSNPPNDRIRAAGGIVWRDSPHGRQLAVIHRPQYDDWTLPKGKVKRGETWELAALREVQEETACLVRLQAFAGQSNYRVEGKLKVVHFWHMELVHEGVFIPNDEVDAIQWLTIDGALEILSYGDEQVLLRKT